MPELTYPTDVEILLTVKDLFVKDKIKTPHPDVTKYVINRLQEIVDVAIPQADALTLDAQLWNLAEENKVHLGPSLVSPGTWVASVSSAELGNGRNVSEHGASMREARNKLLVKLGLARDVSAPTEAKQG